jgi:formate-dependent nitrite reductase cytochrome c552 subunit
MKRRLLISPFVWGLVVVVGGQWLLGLARGNGAGLSTAAPVAMPAVATPVAANRTASTAADLAVVPSNRPSGYQPKVFTGGVDYHGNPVGVACMTCHTAKTPNLEAGRGGVVPSDFHQNLVYKHGGQTCLSCHNSQDYDALRLADGRKLAFAEAQQLCQQCHGQQARDYLHGAHGGMNGYWDKTKGARSRNTCTDCHDPHAPAYPVWTPVFAPIDGGARQQKNRAEKAHSETEASPHE